jgi:hypothetical protein
MNFYRILQINDREVRAVAVKARLDEMRLRLLCVGERHERSGPLQTTLYPDASAVIAQEAAA